MLTLPPIRTAYPNVKKLADGRVETPPLGDNYGRPRKFLIDTNGCITGTVR